jgi:hypothetical protein
MRRKIANEEQAVARSSLSKKALSKGNLFLNKSLLRAGLSLRVQQYLFIKSSALNGLSI